MSWKVVFVRRVVMEMLISEVEKRPALWDKSNKYYRHRQVVDKSWTAVAGNTGISSEYAKYKWKNLRDHFKRELNKIPKNVSGEDNVFSAAYKGKWKYFSSMLFLKNIMLPRRCKISISDDENPIALKHHQLADTSIEHNDNSNFEFNPKIENQTYFKENEFTTQFASSIPSTTSTSTPIRAVLVDESDDEDADFNFLKSLLPYFKKMPPITKLHVRNEFQSILIKELTLMAPETSDKRSYPSSESNACETPPFEYAQLPSPNYRSSPNT